TAVPRQRRGGNGNGRQLRVSLWSDVVQVRTARRRQGTAKGYELCGSGHESTGLGYVGKRRTSLEGFGRTDTNRFSRDPRGKPMWMRSCAILQSTLAQAPIVRVRALSMRMGLVGPLEPES